MVSILAKALHWPLKMTFARVGRGMMIREARTQEETIPTLVELKPKLPVVDYMREELTSSHPLAEALRLLPLERGTIRTFAPDQAAEDVLLHLRVALAPSSAAGMACYRALLDYVIDYLGCGGRRALI